MPNSPPAGKGAKNVSKIVPQNWSPHEKVENWLLDIHYTYWSLKPSYSSFVKEWLQLIQHHALIGFHLTVLPALCKGSVPVTGPSATPCLLHKCCLFYTNFILVRQLIFFHHLSKLNLSLDLPSRSQPWSLVLLVVFLSLQRRKIPTIIANQIIELHSYIKKMMQKSMYLLSLSLSDEAMKRQHNEILRIVALSARKKR